jgi:hypothetical protein
VRENLVRLLFRAQAYEWALLWLESPTRGVGEKWRIQTPRTIERALKDHIDFLRARIKTYGLDPSCVKDIELSPGSKIPRKILPADPISDEVQEQGDPKNLEYQFGGNDPRLEKLTALELMSLGRHGTKDPDPNL